MRVVGDQERSGLSRRRALRLLAGSAGATAAGSMIVSHPAYADSGSESCRFEFTNDPTVAVTTVNQTGGRQDQCSISISGVLGDCPCGGSATVAYAYFVTIPELGTGGIGWISSPAVSVSNNPIWPNNGGSVTVGVGVQVTCVTNGRTAIRCRFGEQTFQVGRNESLVRTFDLTSNNGNGPRPTGIPPCDPPAMQAGQFRAAPLIASSSGEGVWVVPGYQTPVALDTTPDDPADDPIADLGPVDTPPTTTTTAAEPSPSTTVAPDTSTTTTSTTTTSTTTTSTTSPATTSTTSPLPPPAD